jgi:D-aminoacyl-tRNA deacylase
MIGFAYSINDPAGSGMAYKLAERLDGVCVNTNDPRAVARCVLKNNIIMIGFSDDVIYLEYLDDYFKDHDLVAILSRHSSASHIPSLTIHYTGNPRREASFGGDPMSLSFTKPSISTAFLRNIFRAAQENNLSSYSISYEATHHGPTRNRVPIVFLEIGSSEIEWRNPLLHDLWSHAVIKTLSGEEVSCSKIVLGFGGPHYSDRFTRLAIEKRYCFTHIIPRYVLKELDNNDLSYVFDEAYRKTLEKIDSVVVERKSLTSEQYHLLEEKAREKDLEMIRL